MWPEITTFWLQGYYVYVVMCVAMCYCMRGWLSVCVSVQSTQ